VSLILLSHSVFRNNITNKIFKKLKIVELFVGINSSYSLAYQLVLIYQMFLSDIETNIWTNGWLFIFKNDISS